MTSAAKAKGDRAERALLTYLQQWWPNARRGKAGAEKDLGDIFGIRDRDGDDWTLQVADRALLGREHGAVIRKAAQAEAQSERAGTPFWCLVVKRAGCKDPGRWFVWMDVGILIDVIGGATAEAYTWAGVDLFRCEPGVDHGIACVEVRSFVALVAPETDR